MTTWYDVGQFQKRGEKWSFQRLGSARESDKGGWDIFLNALPLTIDGQCRISIQPPRDDTGQRQQGGGYGRGAQQTTHHAQRPHDALDDEVPF